MELLFRSLGIILAYTARSGFWSHLWLDIAVVSVSFGKDSFRSVFCEDNSNVVLRTTDMHAVELCKLILHYLVFNGVKHVCLLNSLQYFNTVN